MLKGVRLPIRWSDLGFPAVPELGDVTLVEGPVGWRWSGAVPKWPIDTFGPTHSEPLAEWGVDHVVILVPDLDVAELDLADAGLRPRRGGKVRGQRALFYRAGPVLEVIEVGVPNPTIYGVALATDLPLEEIADDWRRRGLRVTDPRDAIQVGRRIMVVKDLEAGLAVMSPLPLTPGRTSPRVDGSA